MASVKICNSLHFTLKARKFIPKIVLFGSLNVGRTSITSQIVRGYLPTPDDILDDIVSVNVSFDREPTEVELRDPCPSDFCFPIKEADIRQVDGYILVYAINDREAFEEVKEHYEDIVRVRGTRHGPIVLCGNKCDLESERTVSTSEGEELAQRMGAVFYETSALAYINIREMFYTLVRDIIDWKVREGNKKTRGFIRRVICTFMSAIDLLVSSMHEVI